MDELIRTILQRIDWMEIHGATTQDYIWLRQHIHKIPEWKEQFVRLQQAAIQMTSHIYDRQTQDKEEPEEPGCYRREE